MIPQNLETITTKDEIYSERLYRNNLATSFISINSINNYSINFTIIGEELIFCF
jgi:hypothetical protein